MRFFYYYFLNTNIKNVQENLSSQNKKDKFQELLLKSLIVFQFVHYPGQQNKSRHTRVVWPITYDTIKVRDKAAITQGETESNPPDFGP